MVGPFLVELPWCRSCTNKPHLCERPGISMMVKQHLKACPFCGVATNVPHEKQEGCIQALNREIARMREVLEHVRDPRLDLRREDASG